MNDGVIVIKIPYRSVVTEIALNGTCFSTGFSTRQEGSVVHVDVHIFFSDNVVEKFENVLSEVSDLKEFEDSFTRCFVNLSFLDRDGDIAGFKLIRNPITFAPKYDKK